MARMEDLPEAEQKIMENMVCPIFDDKPWVEGPPLHQRRVAIISTAGLHKKEDRPFTYDPGDVYRVIPGNVQASDLVMSHVSSEFDRTGYQQDWNISFPVDRLKEMQEKGIIGSVADYHYSFMGAHDPLKIEEKAREVARLLLKDKVDAALLVPV